MMRTGLEDLMEKTGAMSPVAAGALRGALLWGGLGAGLGAMVPEEGQSRLRGALYGGLGGAAYGGIRGAARGVPLRKPAHQPDLHEVAPFLRDVSTKADAKARFRAAARKSHPDMGGSTQAMQELNEQWAQAQAHPAYRKFAALLAQGYIRF